MKKTLYAFVKWLIRTALYAVHRKVEVFGIEHIPKDKPVLLLPNHQSALIDVLLIAVEKSIKPYFLTRGDVFGKPVLNSIFKFLQMIPIYRIRDGRNSLSKNDAIFNKCADVLGASKTLVMFPEANHNLMRRVRPLSKGFTRVLFRALEKHPNLDIHIVPVGFNYKDATTFPDDVAVYYGKPIVLKDLLEKKDETDLVAFIKAKVVEGLKEVTTHISAEMDYEGTIAKLNSENINYLRPKEVNKRVVEFSKNENLELVKLPKSSKKFSLLYVVFMMFNFPIILLWRSLVKPKLPDNEFTGTFKFATLFFSFPIYLVLIFVILSSTLNVQIATFMVVALSFFNGIF